MWKRARKLKVTQEDRSPLGGNFVGNRTFKVMDFSSVLVQFGMDGKVLDMGIEM